MAVVLGTHRSRLLLGMARAVRDKGFAAVTVADVVARAGVSKRTFYEHFTGKEQCLVACYVEAHRHVVATVRAELSAARAVGVIAPGRRVDLVLRAYFAVLDRSPEMSRVVIVEIESAGRAGRDVRRRADSRIAHLIRGEVDPGGAAQIDVVVPLVAGVHELVVRHAETAPDLPFDTVRPVAVAFACAVLGYDRPEPLLPRA